MNKKEKKEGYIPIGDFPKYEENPFMLQTIEHIERGQKSIILGTEKNSAIVDTQTGEVLANRLFVRRIPTDKAGFVKVYISHLSKWLYNLSKPAIKLLAYVFEILPISKDKIFLDIDECKEYTGYSSAATITKAIGELLSHEILARTKRTGWYYINPTVFFNGNRLTLIDQYYIEGSENGSPEALDNDIKQID